MTGPDRPTLVSDRPTVGPDDLARLLQSHFRSVGDDFPAAGQLAAVVARTQTMQPRPAWLVSLLSGGPAVSGFATYGNGGAIDASAPTWLSAPALGSTTWRRVVIAHVLLALMVVTTLGAAMVGGWLPDPRRADLPPAVATATPVVDVAPTDAFVPAFDLVAEPFRSDTYGYAIRYPADWRVMPASQRWSGHGVWRVSMADEFVFGARDHRRLSVVSAPVELDVDEQAWLSEHVPVPPEQESDGRHTHCVFRSDGAVVVIEEMVGSWDRTTIDGHPAWVRRGCGYADGVVFLDGRVFLLELYLERMPTAELGLFDAIAETIDLEPARSTELVASERYGYSIALPEGWELTAPATNTWAGSGPWEPGEADVYTHAAAKRTFEVAARAVPKGMGAFDFVGQYVPRRGGAGEPSCGYNGGPITGVHIGGSGPIWAEVRPAPRRTLVRGTCKAVDAVVFIDDIAYVMKLSQTSLNLRAFDELLSALSFDEPPVAVNSPRYGYSIELTRDWQTAPATRDWAGPGRPVASMSDAYIDARAVARFTIASRTKPVETSEDVFVAEAAPLPANVRLDGPEVRCVFGDTVVERGPIPPWATEVIGGHRARVRSMCGTVDAVVFVGDRGYLFTLTSGSGTRGDLERFRELVAAVRFDDGRTTFVSDGYGYSIRYPDDWQVTPATRPWDGSDTADEGMDRFVSTGGGPTTRFTVAVRPAPGSLTEEQWIASIVPPIEVRSGRCGSVVVPIPDLGSHRTTIDGRSAWVRSVCSIVDAVVFDDGLGYWLRLVTPKHRRDGDLATFGLLADTIDLDAVPPAVVAAGETPAATTKTFTSVRYGYTIRIPVDWKVKPAPKRKRGETLQAGRTADEFAEPIAFLRRFSVTARSLGGSPIDDAWLGTFVPDPSTVRGTICRQADGTPRSILKYVSAGRTWREAVVAGRPARLRGLCGQVQAVLQVGETAFVLTSIRNDTDERAFRQIADTFRIAP